MQSFNHSNIYVSNTALEAVLREMTDDYEMEDFWKDRYTDGQLEALRELGDEVGDQVIDQGEQHG